MTTRKHRWWGRAIIALALLAIALFYAGGAAVFWVGMESVAFAAMLPAPVNFIAAAADFGWALAGVRAL